MHYVNLGTLNLNFVGDALIQDFWGFIRVAIHLAKSYDNGKQTGVILMDTTKIIRNCASQQTKTQVVMAFLGSTYQLGFVFVHMSSPRLQSMSPVCKIHYA